MRKTYEEYIADAETSRDDAQETIDTLRAELTAQPGLAVQERRGRARQLL